MKFIIIPIWFVLAAFAQASVLDFAETQKEIRPAPEAETAALEFSFTNTTKNSVTITKADAGCSCMKVLFSGGKLTYAPGESGILRAIFMVGQYSGTVDRTISLWLDTAPTNPATQTIKARIEIPTLIAMEPKTLKWAIGRLAAPQTIHIRMAEGQTIHATKITLSSESFSAELKTLQDGRSYDVIVTPRDVTTPGLGVIRIETDSKVPKLQTQLAFAVVQQPVVTDQVIPTEMHK